MDEQLDKVLDEDLDNEVDNEVENEEETAGFTIGNISLTYMQDFANLTYLRWHKVVEGMKEEQPYKLIDNRDGNEYTIAKLKDGKVWMCENLRLGGEKEIVLTSEDSDVAENFNLPASSTEGFKPDRQKEICVYVDKTYGGYYSWIAAVAGVGNEIIAPYSIAPKGWKLPLGGFNYGGFDRGDFRVLAKAYGNGTDRATSEALRKIPTPGFELSGCYDNGAADEQEIFGYWWASLAEVTISDSTPNPSTFSMVIDDSSVDPYHHTQKGYGFSVRCLLREPENPANQPTVAFSDYASLRIDPKKLQNSTYPLSGTITITSDTDLEQSFSQTVSFASAEDIKRVVFMGLTPETEYTVKFVSTSGEDTETEVELESFTTTKKDDPLKFFSHWAKEGEDGQEYDFQTPVTSDFTLNGVWNTVYLVKFMDEDGVTELYEEKSVIDGSDTDWEMPENPTRDGYIFKGWKDSSNGEKWEGTSPPTDNMTLIADWQIAYGRARGWSDFDRAWSEPETWSEINEEDK